MVSRRSGPLLSFLLCGVFHSISFNSCPGHSTTWIKTFLHSLFAHPTNVYYTLTTYQALCKAVKQSDEKKTICPSRSLFLLETKKQKTTTTKKNKMTNKIQVCLI
jgi:hypothetical protein